MHTKFLAGCAMAALTVTAGAANAQDFKVTIKGDAMFQGVFASQKADADTRGVDFRNRFRFWVNPEATGLGGALTYGANVRMIAGNSDSSASFDYNYIYASGAFGSVRLGNLDTYSDDITLAFRPSDFQAKDDAAYSFVKKSNEKIAGTNTATYGSASNQLEAWRDSSLLIGGTNNTAGDLQSSSIRYTSPTVSGLQVAVQYSPNGSDGGWSFSRSKATIFQDAIEIGALFNSKDKTIADKFGDAVLQVGADYQHAKNGVAGFKDWDAYQFGATVGYKTFTFGGAFQTFGKSGLSDADVSKASRYSWNLGAQYGIGDFLLGAGYNYAQKDADFAKSEAGTASSTVGKKTSQAFFTGVRYTVSKGLNVYGEYAYVKNRNTAANLSDNANVVVLSTKLSF